MTLAELLAHRDELPRPLGLEVARCEILPDGKATPWVDLFKLDKSAKVIITQNIKS